MLTNRMRPDLRSSFRADCFRASRRHPPSPLALLDDETTRNPQVRVRMGRYGPYLECGNITRPAIPHASTAAGRKDPTDLSLPPPPPLSRSPRAPPASSSPLPENPPLQPSAGLSQGVGRQAKLYLSSSFPVGNTNVSSADVTQDLPQLAEDVIAFGVGLGGKNVAANASDGVSHRRNGEAEARAWYSAVSLERAVGLLSLPRIICDSHPAEGGPIEVGIGRYGVYVKHRELYKMVPKGIDVLDVDEALAVDLVDEVIQVMRGKGSFAFRSSFFFWYSIFFSVLFFGIFILCCRRRNKN